MPVSPIPAIDPPGEAAVPSDFGASLESHGLYSTTQFVLRLSPRIHEMVDAVHRGDFDSHDAADLIDSYSTFLHETVHWWQHVGSSAGLIFSLCYPAQFTSSVQHLQAAIKGAGPKKPLRRWAENTLRNGMGPSDALANANVAVNNALDIQYYKFLAHSPARSDELLHDRYFESVGHSYRVAYGNTVMALIESCDLSGAGLPDPHSWQSEFDRLMLEGQEGFFRGSPIRKAQVGLHAIFEGQARFIQLQYLAGSGGPSTMAECAQQGYFDGIYGKAFQEFLNLSESEWPDRVEHPLVGLFLLICDLAINPTRGFPLEIEDPEDFISDVDPGARFTLLCHAARENPGTKSAIVAYTREEYDSVSSILVERCRYDRPELGLQAIVDLSDTPQGRLLMEEWQTFEYPAANLPIRVMTTHYFDFCRSKLAAPHFFCWAGRALAWSRADAPSQAMLGRHLSLFTDKAEAEQIFARIFEGRDGAAVKRMLDVFMGSTILYELTLQWILVDGPFRYNFAPLTGRKDNASIEQWAKVGFGQIFGHVPDDFELLA